MVAPQPDRLGRLPLQFADEDMIGLGRLTPVDQLRRIAGLVVAELPKGFALADAAPAVHALEHRGGNPFRRDQQRRQSGGQLLGASSQGQGTAGHQSESGFLSSLRELVPTFRIECSVTGLQSPLARRGGAP
jgi:hypothetical protein